MYMYLFMFTYFMMHNNSISTPRVARIHRASTRTTRPHSCALSRYEHAVASHLDLVLLVQLLTVFLPFAVCFNQLKQQQSARVCVCLTSWPYLSLMQASRGYELALIHGDGPNLGRRVKHPLFLIDCSWRLRVHTGSTNRTLYVVIP